MKKNTRYILDLNGVVQEYASEQVKKFGIHLMLRFKMSPWMFAGIIRDIKNHGEKVSPKAQKFVDLYYKNDQHIKTPFLPGALECVRNLVQNHPVHICSANKHTNETDKRYADYLIKTLGKLEDVHFVKPAESKLNYYKSVKLGFPNDEIIVIDDSPAHIKAAESIGLKTMQTDRNIGIAGLKKFAR